MLSDRAKHLLRTWVVPPGFIEARRAASRPPRTHQKFWAGTPVPAPACETAFFARAGLACETITRQDDSRAAARVEGRVRLPLPTGAAGQACELAVLAAGNWFDADRVHLVVSGLETVHSGLSPRTWLDVRLNVPEGSTVLEIESTAAVLVTMPRTVQLSRPASPPASPPPRHFILLVLDGWSERMAGTTHPTEPSLPLTPNIDRFFSKGLRSDIAYSAGEWTLPTVASIFTGLCTMRHRHYRALEQSTLPTDRRLLAEHFQAAGYHTMALSPANRITPAFGHHRGFDRFVYHWPAPGRTERDYDPALWLSEIVGQLDVHQHDRTFSYVHLPDTHPAWHVPPITRAFNLQRRGSSTGLQLEALERSELGAGQGRQLNLLRLHELDRMLAGLFGFVEQHLSDKTVVVLTADHGTPWSLLRDVRPVDEPYLVDDRTTIMLKIRGPGVPARTLDTLTTPNVDLMPTLLKLAGLSVPGDLDGRDLTEPSYARDHVISESVFKGVYEIAVRDGVRVYFEKYPMDEAAATITGPPHYARLFAAGTPDYASPLSETPGRLRDLAHAHIRRLGLIRDDAP